MSLEHYINEKLVIKSIREQESNADYTIKFSVNVDEIMNRRLMAVGEELGVKRAEFARELMEIALGQLEDKLGLDYLNPESEYSKRIFAGLTEVPLYAMGGKKFASLSPADFFDAIQNKRDVPFTPFGSDVQPVPQQEGAADNE